MEPSAPVPTRRRSRMLLLAVAIAAAVVALLGATLWWRSYQVSPTRSVTAISSAIRSHDQATVMRYVDIDEMIRRRLVAGGSTATAGVPPLDATYVNALAAANAPGIRAQVQDVLDPLAHVPVSTPSVLDTPVRASDVRRVVYEGDEASVTVSLPSARGDFDVELRMRRVGDEWHVVGFDGDLRRVVNQ